MYEGTLRCEIAAEMAISQFAMRAQRTALMRMTHGSPPRGKAYSRLFAPKTMYGGFFVAFGSSARRRRRHTSLEEAKL